MKRLQRYNLQFPDLFPKVLQYGIVNGTAYFDLEYIPNTMTLHSWLTKTSDPREIDSVFDKLIQRMKEIHSITIPSESSTHLYFYEEVEHKLFACFQHSNFRKFALSKEICFNGIWIPTIFNKIDEYKQQMLEFKEGNIETFSHGNLTLENILIDPYTQTITFIDPYEENIIDSALTDYSQILQSYHGKYELYNAKKP